MLIECIDTADIRKQYFNCTDLKTLFNSVAGDTIKGTFEIVSKEVLWSVRGSYQTI